MSASATLLLHWHLDEVIDVDGVLDASTNHLNGTAEGGPKNLPDDRFGSCVVLDGAADALVLAPTPRLDFPAGYTVAAWIDPHRLSDAGIVGTTSGLFALSIDAQGAVGHASDGVAAAAPPGSVGTGGWHHLAGTSDGQTVRTYLDGLLVAEAPTRSGEPRTEPDSLVVGRSPRGGGWFDGRLVHVRVYAGALSAEEIRLDMAEDEAELAAFVRAHPVDFELVNADQQSVLYIDDSSVGQRMTLRLRNTARQQFAPSPLIGPVSATVHHLALRFRPQSLAATPDPVLETPGWTMAREADTLYFRCADTTPLDPGGTVALRLHGLAADGRGGTRGTRVDLEYQHWAFTGETDELTGSHLQFLNIVNHLGRTDLPLRAGCYGGNRVLADGSATSKVVLRIANLSHDAPLRLTGTDTAEGADAATRIVIGFDVEHAQESRDWALITAQAAASATLTVTATSDPTALPTTAWPQPSRQIGAQRVQWPLTCSRSLAVPPTGWIEVTLDGIIPPVSLGPAEISVGYLNVPGYADAATAVTVEKSPLLFVDQRVAISTGQPAAKLHILDAPSDANQGTLILGPVAGSNLRLGYDAGYSWLQSHGSKPLALNPVGNNVGIGATDPGAKLTVVAPSTHLQLRRDVTAAPGGNLLFLELFQAHAADDVNPSIRFHHSNVFWHRIEARQDGFHLKTGDTTVDTLVDLHANAIDVADSLVLRGRRFGEAQVQILTSLVNGELEVDLITFPQNRSLGRVTLRPVDGASG